jgi:hypothetical protein
MITDQWESPTGKLYANLVTAPGMQANPHQRWVCIG